MRVIVATLRTPLCEELGIDCPILSAGFASGAGPDLVAAVSNAGGLGVLGATGLTPERIAGLITQTRRLTSRAFGINFIIDADTADDLAFLRAEVAAAASQRVAAVVLFWGDPAPYVEEAHRSGVKVLIQVGSVEEA